MEYLRKKNLYQFYTKILNTIGIINLLKTHNKIARDSLKQGRVVFSQSKSQPHVPVMEIWQVFQTKYMNMKIQNHEFVW